MHKILLLAFIFHWFSGANAQKNATEVLLLGTFHFSNPGLDLAKFENANILSSKRQAEVQQVVKQLITYRPDKIFIEDEPSRQSRWDSLFQQYEQGTLPAKADEIFQVAFPVARTLGHPRVYCADYRDAIFPADSLMKVLAENGQTAQLAGIQTKIQQVEQRFNENLKKHTVSEILRIENDPQEQKDNVAFYLSTLSAGTLRNHVGAYLASEWWRRNMIIYGNVLKQLKGDEKRILILFGSAHTALIKSLIDYNSAFRLVAVKEVLK